MNRPVIAISMGDPFGNGPEITIKALSRKEVYDRCRPLVVGDLSSLRYAARVAEAVNGIKVTLHKIASISEAVFEPGVIDILDLGLISPDRYPAFPEPESSLLQKIPQRSLLWASDLPRKAATRLFTMS